MTRFLAIAGAILIGGMSATAAMAAKDDFNRAELGPKWRVKAGSLSIENDALQGASGSLGYFRPSKNAVSASVTAQPSGVYAAVALGDIRHLNNAFVKVESAAGQWGSASFAEGNDTNGTTFQLPILIGSDIRISVSMCGTVATLTIKPEGGRAMKFTHDYGKTFPTGAGLGVGFDTILDDYASKTTGCTADPKAIVIGAPKSAARK